MRQTHQLVDEAVSKVRAVQSNRYPAGSTGPMHSSPSACTRHEILTQVLAPLLRLLRLWNRIEQLVSQILSLSQDTFAHQYILLVLAFEPWDTCRCMSPHRVGQRLPRKCQARMNE